MHKSLTFCWCVLLAHLVVVDLGVGEARYLPTRSNGDRVDKLRELLKELLENEIDKEESSYQQDSPPRWHPESKLFYKREIPATSTTSDVGRRH